MSTGNGAAGSGAGSAPIWGGRFTKRPAEEAFELGRSLGFDVVLIHEDVAASKAHVGALERAGLVTADEATQLRETLDRVPDLIVEVVEGSEGAMDLEDLYEGIEDVHSLVEHVVTEQLGETGAKLHAGRSRNDLVATDFRLWCLNTGVDLADGLVSLLNALLIRAREGAEMVMPGLTHNRPAQVVTLGYHLAAHGFALTRDLDRIDDWFARSAVSPLGAGALATSTLGLDPQTSAEELGFETAFANALDATADRDFALEFVSVQAILAVHLSRVAADLARWSEPSLGYAEMDEAYSTGSSMMPQKRNPDVAELVRGKAGRIAGDLVTLTTLLAGLPLGYHRDLQEDKEPVFDAARTLLLVLPALEGCLATIRFNEGAMRGDARSEDLYATDLAESLVRSGVPFREAHRTTGELLKRLAGEKRGLHDMTSEEWTAFGLPDGAAMLDPDASVGARNMPGGPSPERVLEQCVAIEAILADRA